MTDKTPAPAATPDADPAAQDRKARAAAFLAAITTDPKLENDGAWVRDILPEWPGIDVKIRSASSQKARDWIMAKAREQRAQLTATRGKLPAALEEKNNVDWIAEAILVDWTGIPDAEQEWLPFSVEAAKVMLGHRLFREAVQRAAADNALFQAGAVDAQEKN